ncbi:MAG: LacI family DNA-binding transcriptional regulator [Faecalimonas sp.]|nr:LacI family DNA-binding transcriptional regulator [Faecalimonas sp.]
MEEQGRHTRVTIKDIAKRTGYSINAVSRALNGKSDISEATRQLIERTADEMGYIRNSLAGGLRSGITRTIAVLVSDISNPLFGIMVREMEILFDRLNYSMFVMNTNEDPEKEKKAVLTALSHHVDGFIICPTQQTKESFDLLEQEGIPYVLLGRHFDEGQMNSVIWDDYQGGYAATEYLLSLNHRRILCLGSSPHISSARERIEGYRAALADAEIPIDERLIYEVNPFGDNIRDILQESLGEQEGFTAIFAYSDMIAWEAISQLTDMGKRVPEDVSVVGFDGIQSKLNLPCRLTTVITPKTKMATEVVEAIMKLIQKDIIENKQVVIPVELAVRDTTRKLDLQK